MGSVKSLIKSCSAGHCKHAKKHFEIRADKIQSCWHDKGKEFDSANSELETA